MQSHHVATLPLPANNTIPLYTTAWHACTMSYMSNWAYNCACAYACCLLVSDGRRSRSGVAALHPMRFSSGWDSWWYGVHPWLHPKCYLWEGSVQGPSAFAPGGYWAFVQILYWSLLSRWASFIYLQPRAWIWTSQTLHSSSCNEAKGTLTTYVT